MNPAPPVTKNRMKSPRGLFAGLRAAYQSDVAQAVQDPLQQAQVGMVADELARPVDGDKPLFGHVGDHDSRDAEWHLHARGDLRHGLNILAQPDDGAPLPAEIGLQLALVGAGDERLDLQVIVPRPRPASGDRIQADHRALARLAETVGVVAAHLGSDAWSSARSCGVSTSPVRATSSAISYPTRPTSQEGAARTPRHEPSPMVMTNRKPRSISITVWLTSPASSRREAPEVRLATPEATAESWSARARSSRSETAISSPSDETTIAWATPGVPRTKVLTSQLRFWASLLSEIINAPWRHRAAAGPRRLIHVVPAEGLSARLVAERLGTGGHAPATL